MRAQASAEGSSPGEEREFAGFAYVEQRDTESFDGTQGKGTFPEWPAVDNDEFHTAPCLTKTWFHTGASLHRKKLEQKLAEDWWSPPGSPPPPPPPPALTLPDELAPFDRRECVRALRGAVLRREVYGLDGSEAEAVPYLVEQKGYDVRLLQGVQRPDATRPRNAGAGSTHLVERETRHAVHERSATGARLIQHLALDVDAYGTVLREAVVAYPKASGEPEQTRLHIAVSERDVVHVGTSSATERRLAVPIEERLFELHGATVPTPFAPFTTSDILDALGEATPLAYESPWTTGIRLRLLERIKTRYFDSASLPNPLTFGAVDAMALPYETYRLDITSGVLTAAGLSTDVTAALLTEGGYLELPGETGWWTPSGRAIPSAAEFYQPTTIRDPRGRDVTLTYDPHHLLVTSAVDPLGNTVAATIDYRSLAYREITDPNGNRQEARFDGLGRLTHLALKGKTTETLGDTLADPTEQYQYDATRWRTAQKPAFARALLREMHGPTNTRFLESYTYSDGGGAVVMVKQKVEPGPSPHHVGGVLQREPDGTPTLAPVNPRWVGTGRTVLDNKGSPVKQYEPYFSDLNEYEDEEALEKWGVSPLIAYDPVGRVTRVDHPDESFETYTRDAWTETAFDRNDNDDGGPHESTPTTSHLDPLGRPFLVDQHNGGTEHLLTRVVMDLEGAVRSVIDPLDRTCSSFIYSMGGQLLKETNIDAGVHRSFANVMGSPIRRWDDGAPTRVHRFAYDALERPTHRWATFGVFGTDPEVLLQRMYYGEAAATPLTNNLRGQLVLAYDAAGQTKNVRYDFRGRLEEVERKLAVEYDAEPDWSALDAVTDPATAETTAASALESSSPYAETRQFDALGRPTSVTTPDASETKPTYNEAGLLETVEVRVRGGGTWTTFVSDIDYDEKGRRTSITYGNGTTTEYGYDPLTYRLSRLTTTRASDNAVLQNLAYTYVPVGNITAIADTSEREPIFDNTVASPSATYTYDAVYRLIAATGREHAGGVADVQRGVDDLPLNALPHPNDPTAVRLYEEAYTFDLAGNLLSMAHTAVGTPGASWTRHHAYAAGSNGLSSTSLPGDTVGVLPYSAQYTHDDHGNITSMPHLASITHDHADRMKTADLGGGGTAHYVYRADGSRARKVIERIGTLVEERIYLGGWELYRKRDHTGLLLERETLHVMDDKRRVAMIETKTVDTAAGPFTVTPRMRFQLDDHIWSARLECDETGLVISYEEFHPYGTSAYRSARSGVEVSERRYRYTGKERDDETGFQIHGLRYYVPWLGRWTTSDPIGLQGGLNGYGYCRGDPVGKVDPGGTDSIGICREPGRTATRDDVGPTIGPADPANRLRPPEATPKKSTKQPSPPMEDMGAGGHEPFGPSTMDGVEGGEPSPGEAGQADRDAGLFVLGLALLPAAGFIGVSARTAVFVGAGGSAVGKTPEESTGNMAAGLSLGIGGKAGLAEREGVQAERAAAREAAGGESSRSGAWSASKEFPNTDWKSRPTFGHAFEEHGAQRSTRSLMDRMRGTGNPQGQWLDNEAAAQFIQGEVPYMGGKSGTVPLPKDLGQVIRTDGSIVPATRAQIVFRRNGTIRTAFPIE